MYLKNVLVNGIIILLEKIMILYYHMDIKPLLELASAKVACKIRGTTTESIRKDFGII